jgi:hypothetical protein
MVARNFGSLVFSLGIIAPLAGFVGSTACTSKFEGCEASRSCDSDAGEGGDGGVGGKQGSAGKGGSAGKAGSAGKGGSGGKGGSPAVGGEGGAEDTGGTAGTGGLAGTAGNSGKGGTGGTGGADEGMGGESGSGTEPEADKTPPEIVSVSPEDGERGVRADTVIRITFSEPMHRVNTEAAYQSADIPSAETTRSWNQDSTVLTIEPNDELIYVTGAENDLAFDAMLYALAMTDTATDLAGNRLEPEEWSFSTLRRFVQTLTATGDDVRRLRNGGSEPCTEGMHLGDNDENQTLGGFVQYHLDELAPGIDEYEYAQLYGERLGGLGKGQPNGLDPVRVREFSGDILLAGLDTTVGPDLGVFIQSTAVEYPNLSVLPAMTSSYADDELIQFRLRLEPQMSNLDDSDDYFMVACDLELRLRYLAP